MDHEMMGMGWRTRRRSGQIPAFGDWDYVNELPITQYFESAAQAGLVRRPRHHHCVCCSAALNYGSEFCYDHATPGPAACCDLYAPPGFVTDQWASPVPTLKKKKKNMVRGREQRRSGIQHHQQHEENQEEEIPWSKQEVAATPRTIRRNQQGIGAMGGGARRVFDIDLAAKLSSPTYSSDTVNKRHPHIGAGKYRKDTVPEEAARKTRRAPKAVDEDLYKIPPHLLRSSRHRKQKKKKLGFIRSCWGVAC